jgi:hypothetical protein
VGFSGASKQRENSMVRIRVESPHGPIEVLAVVVLCAAEGNLQRMEAKLFATDPNTLQAWLGLYAALG